MKLRRVLAVARKEFLHIVRDPRSLAMGIAIPMMMLFLFGYALTLDVDDVPFIVWDQSGTAVSRDFVSHFSSSRYFSLVGGVTSYREIHSAIDERRALLAIVIPHDFARLVGRGRTAGVQVIADGSDANTAAMAIGYAEAIASVWSRGVAIERALRAGGIPIKPPLDVRPRVWFNEELESRNYIVPGLIAVIMMIIAALLTSLTIAREWETGTMEQVISTPLRGPELIAGKLIPYFTIAAADVVLSVVMGVFLFHVPLRGSPLFLVTTSSMFLLGGLCLGMVISIVTKSQLLATQLAMVTTFLPAFLLSGFMYDIGNMPRALQVITYAIPARYFVALLKAIFLKGVGIDVLWRDGVFLGIFALVMVVVAITKFKKKLV